MTPFNIYTPHKKFTLHFQVQPHTSTSYWWGSRILTRTEDLGSDSLKLHDLGQAAGVMAQILQLEKTNGNTYLTGRLSMLNAIIHANVIR